MNEPIPPNPYREHLARMKAMNEEKRARREELSPGEAMRLMGELHEFARELNPSWQPAALPLEEHGAAKLARILARTSRPQP